MMTSLPLQLLFTLLNVFLAASQTDDLWEYPGYYWKAAYPDADNYWLSIYADDCDYIFSIWDDSRYATTYEYNLINCETLNNNFDNAINACEADDDCDSMLLQIFYEDHDENIEHWGDHVAYLYKTSASLLGDSIEPANWTTQGKIASIYVEKNEQEPLLASCFFVTASITCRTNLAKYLLIPQWYYDQYYHPKNSFDSSLNNSIVSKLSTSEYIYQECNLDVLYNQDEFNAGIHYCIDAQEYKLIATGGNSTALEPDETALKLRMYQYGNTLVYWQVESREVRRQSINVTDSSTISDNDDCDIYQQTSYFSWKGDGLCDGELNKIPCWDGGDCCPSTCVGYQDSEYECGEKGYHCINPNATEYKDLLELYSVSVQIEISNNRDIDVTIDDDSDDYSITSSEIESGFYITVIDHTSGAVSDNQFFDVNQVDEASNYILNVPYQQFVLVYGSSNDDLMLVSVESLESIGIYPTDYDSIDDLSGTPFIFFGRKGGDSSIPSYNTYVDNIALWKAFSYDITEFFQYVVQSAPVDQSTTFWLDEDCEFGDISYRYYVMDSIGASTFSLSAYLEYFSLNEACSTSLESSEDISGRIAVIEDGVSCVSSRKIANAQMFGAVGIIIINTRHNGEPNIEFNGDSRDLSIDDITIPVLAVGRSDGIILNQRLFSEQNTWRTGVEIYKYPNYTISNTRRCAAPKGLYETASCIDGESFLYDNCTECTCNNGEFLCELDDCLDSRQPDCDFGEIRIFHGSGSFRCCGRCVEEQEEEKKGKKNNDSKGVWPNKFTFSQKVMIILFSIIAVVILISIAIVSYVQRGRHTKAHLEAIVNGDIDPPR